MNPSTPFDRPRSRRFRSAFILFGVLAVILPIPAFAGGPRIVAGASYFDPAVKGVPVTWAGGQVNYFVDQGPLNASISNSQATAMVDAAASLWSAVPTAGAMLTRAGSLNEDVSGLNVVPGNNSLLQPSDVAPSAVQYPVAIIFDADGSVLDAVFGAYTSDPSNCQYHGVTAWLDGIESNATFSHAIIVLNGRCAVTSGQIAMMQFMLERAFGIVLGLGFSQVNYGALANGMLGGAEGWPVMQPESGACGPAGGICIPDPSVLRLDDIAQLNRLYPITADTLASFPGKVLTAANTVSLDGTLTFRAGSGMQGVNVVLRPLDANGNPMNEYAVTSVSGSYFSGKHGNAVTGYLDSSGTPLSRYGSDDPALQGYFDLRYIPLPPGFTTVNYQLSFENIDPIYIGASAVGPYSDGTPWFSGTLQTISVPGLTADAVQTLNLAIEDSATGSFVDPISTESAPRMLPPSGLWCGRLSQISQTDWFAFPIRGQRTFTIVTEALDENGQPSNHKAMPVLGVWDAFAPVGSSPAGASPGLNGNSPGETWLQVSSAGADVVRLGIADQRGDGRPDYAYNGWVLYADSVEPPRLPSSGGPIVIHGMGFHIVDTVSVGGQPAQVTSVSPNEITAIAPPAVPGVTGPVDVEVDDLPVYYALAIISGGLSYDAGTGDALTLITAPSNTVPSGLPLAFTVEAVSPTLAPAGGVTVTYTVASGTATLGCGKPSCQVSAGGDGLATMAVTAVDSTPSVVIAALTNGSSLQAHFSGGLAPVLAALTPTISIAAGATVAWPTQALVLSNGIPAGNQAVTWQTAASGIAALGSNTAISTSAGIASNTLTIGPLAEGQQAVSTACLNGTSQCVTFTATGARSAYTTLQPLSGTVQSVSVSATPASITMRLLDVNGNPVAGGLVTLYQSAYAWAPPCPAHGRCAQAQLVAAQTSSATSALDGTVAFSPASPPGVTVNVIGVAAAGNSSTVPISIEIHP